MQNEKANPNKEGEYQSRKVKKKKKKIHYGAKEHIFGCVDSRCLDRKRSSS